MQRFRALLTGLWFVVPFVGAAAQSTSRSSDRAAARGDSVSPAVRPAPWVTGGDLKVLGAGVGLAFLAQRVDLTVRNELQRAAWQESYALESLEHVGDQFGGKLALFGGVALWGGGAVMKNRTVAAVGLRAYESVMISGVITKTLKAAFGRARPRVDSTDAWNVEWLRRGGNDYEAMPSGHTSAAFAFAAAVTSEVALRAPRHAKLVGATTFTLAGITAWSRMHADAHWLSDVTMGAAIGMASGWAVARWHATRPDNWIDRTVLPQVAPGSRGQTHIGVRVAWR